MLVKGIGSLVALSITLPCSAPDWASNAAFAARSKTRRKSNFLTIKICYYVAVNSDILPSKKRVKVKRFLTSVNKSYLKEKISRSEVFSIQ
jgi:hypothetical protein